MPKAFLVPLVSPLPQEGQNTTLTSPAFLTNPLEQETHVDSILLWHIKRNWIAGLTLSLAGFLFSDGLLPVPTTVPPSSREGRERVSPPTFFNISPFLTFVTMPNGDSRQEETEMGWRISPPGGNQRPSPRDG